MAATTVSTCTTCDDLAGGCFDCASPVAWGDAEFARGRAFDLVAECAMNVAELDEAEVFAAYVARRVLVHGLEVVDSLSATLAAWRAAR